MPRLVFFICCGSSAIDYRSNLLSIFNVAEQLELSANPPPDAIAVTSLEAISLWERQDGEENAPLTQRIRIVAPSGEEAGATDIEFAMEKIRQRVTSRFHHLPIREVGRYEVRMWIRPRAEADWPAVPTAVYFLPVVRSA